MKRITLFLAITILTLTSCSKKIEGNVVDNFGKPLKGVSVSIRKSDYATTTNGKGNYTIDYAPGEIVINFKKENYIGYGDVLYITEKQTYPLKQVTLYKIPVDVGIYISSPEMDDYIKLVPEKDIKIETIREPKNGFTAQRSISMYFVENTDNKTIIKLDKLDDVKIVNYGYYEQLLGKLDEDMKVAELRPYLFKSHPYVNNAIKTENKEIKSNYTTMTFTPVYNVDYVIVDARNLQSKNRLIYTFRFENK